MNTREFNRCVEENADNLYRFIIGIIRRENEAEDIIQESYARLWNNRTQVVAGKEKSYLFTIAYRLAISELRQRHRCNYQELSIAQCADTVPYDNLVELLWQALETLNEASRSTLMLCDWEGYSYSEIAQIMDMSLAQVKITIYRARIKIKEQLSDEYRP